jgi:hypothetical protein
MPRCKPGQKLFCEIRGWVPVKRISPGRIPWPQTLVPMIRAFIICGDLVKAVRQESAAAVCYWWGVTPQTVTVWRKALGIGPVTEGTSRVRGCRAREILGAPEVRRRALIGANSPEANAKKAAARRGVR